MPFANFTPAEQIAINDVLAHQQQYSTFSPIMPSGATELHIALDSTGTNVISRQIHPAQGGHLTPAMVAAASSAGCRLVHNHPSQGSLSSHDWNSLASYPAMEMTAVNSQRTTFRGKVLMASAFSNWAVEIQNAYDSVENQFQAEISKWFSANQRNLALFAMDNEWLVGVALGERLHAKGYADYEFLPAGSDSTALLSPYASTIQQQLNSWYLIQIP